MDQGDEARVRQQERREPVDAVADQPPQRGAFRVHGGELAGEGLHPGAVTLGQGDEQRVFVGEEAVERADRGLGAGRDVVGGRLGEAQLQEHGVGGVEDGVYPGAAAGLHRVTTALGGGLHAPNVAPHPLRGKGLAGKHEQKLTL